MSLEGRTHLIAQRVTAVVRNEGTRRCVTVIVSGCFCPALRQVSCAINIGDWDLHK